MPDLSFAPHQGSNYPPGRHAKRRLPVAPGGIWPLRCCVQRVWHGGLFTTGAVPRGGAGVPLCAFPHHTREKNALLGKPQRRSAPAMVNTLMEARPDLVIFFLEFQSHVKDTRASSLARRFSRHNLTPRGSGFLPVHGQTPIPQNPHATHFPSDPHPGANHCQRPWNLPVPSPNFALHFRSPCVYWQARSGPLSVSMVALVCFIEHTVAIHTRPQMNTRLESACQLSMQGVHLHGHIISYPGSMERGVPNLAMTLTLIGVIGECQLGSNVTR